MSSSCALAIFGEVNALESGVQPYPIFFLGPNCDQSQYPQPGEPLSPNFIGSTFNLRSQACRKANGQADDTVSTTNCGNNCIESIPINTCPLPAVRSIILPSNMTVVFDSSGSDFPQFIRDPGKFTLTSGLASNNVYIVSTEVNSPAKWRSSLDSTGGCVGDNGSGVYDDGYNYFMHPTQARQSFDNVSARMTQSNLSCGSPWWPSLTSSIFNGSGFNITVDGGSWELIGRDEDYVDAIRPATYCYTNYNGIQGTISGNVSYFLRANVDIPEPLINAYCSQETRAYSTNECLQGKDALGNFPSQTQQGICACSQIEQGACITSGRRHTCYCQDLERQSNGTIKNITIKYTSSNTWADQQLRYCLGLDKLSIGGVDIQRYGNSSAACDEIVPQFCFSTAWVTANPELSKGCGCLIEEKKLQVQFAGLDLPVQCFSSLCSNSDPNIYRTVEQNSGCDARICTQIISINGSDIASQGFQTILCNGELYSTQTVNPSQTPVPTITPSTSGGVQLDAVFFISLGLLVFMVLLLVVYGIRKAVLQKRTQTRDRDLITQALQTAIGQK